MSGTMNRCEPVSIAVNGGYLSEPSAWTRSLAFRQQWPDNYGAHPVSGFSRPFFSPPCGHLEFYICAKGRPVCGFLPGSHFVGFSLRPHRLWASACVYVPPVPRRPTNALSNKQLVFGPYFFGTDINEAPRSGVQDVGSRTGEAVFCADERILCRQI